MGGDRQRIRLLEHLEPALRHREWVVAELDLAGFLVALVHREIGDPTELEEAVFCQTEFTPDLEPRRAGKSGEVLGHAANEEDSVGVVETELRPQVFGPFRSKAPRDGPGTFPVPKEDVAEPRLALGLSPRVHAVTEGSVTAGGRRDCRHADIGIRIDLAREHLEPGTAKVRGCVLHLERIAEVGLVAAVLTHSLRIGNAWERRRRYRPSVAEFLEHAAHHRLDRSKDVLLRHERHLQIELIMLARRAVGTARLVPEAWGDLKIAVEPGNHQQLLELLW